MPRVTQWLLGIVYVALLWFTFAVGVPKNETPLRQSWNDFIWRSAEWFSVPLTIAGLFIGGICIARERQRETWETLALTRLSNIEILFSKLSVAYLQVAATFLPWLLFVCRGAYITELSDYGQLNSLKALALMMPWEIVTSALRLLVSILVGMSLSIHSRKVKGALGMCGALVAGYAGLWYFANTVTWGHHDSEYLLWHVLYWPVRQITFRCPTYWEWRVVADVILGVGLPLLCWMFLRLSFRSTIRR